MKICANCGHPGFFHQDNSCDYDVPRNPYDPRRTETCSCTAYKVTQDNTTDRTYKIPD